MLDVCYSLAPNELKMQGVENLHCVKNGWLRVKEVCNNREDFDPTKFGLKADFRLTKLTEYKGCGCKVPREPLLNLLAGLTNSKTKAESSKHEVALPSFGIGMDSCVVPLKQQDSFLIQTTDFFFPLIEDPYLMGRVTAANVLSDLYAMGVVDCDNMLMLLGVSTRLSDEERDVIVPLVIRGFEECCAEAGTAVTGGQTVRNEWLLLGGVASSVCRRAEFVTPDGARAGDVLVLTKPLGIQVAVNAHQWLEQQPHKYEQIRAVLDPAATKRVYFRAVESLCRLNRTAARLMHTFDAHAATDVTGFGLMGHASNLAGVQRSPVSFRIHTLPVIAETPAVASLMKMGLLRGTQAETSGGLLIAFSPEKAEAFCKEIEKVDGYPAWVVGQVVEGDRTASLVNEPRVIEV